MKLTEYEKNITLVSLDHMEEYLFITEEAGDISEDTYDLRMKAVRTARTKIKQL